MLLFWKALENYLGSHVRENTKALNGRKNVDIHTLTSSLHEKCGFLCVIMSRLYSKYVVHISKIMAVGIMISTVDIYPSGASFVKHCNTYMYMHTECPKKKTYHFFRATLTKIHNINIWTQISFSTPYEAHLKN